VIEVFKITHNIGLYDPEDSKSYTRGNKYKFFYILNFILFTMMHRNSPFQLV